MSLAIVWFDYLMCARESNSSSLKPKNKKKNTIFEYNDIKVAESVKLDTLPKWHTYQLN